MGDSGNKPKIPLKTKFKVWWEGYDIHDVEARLRALEPKDPPRPVKAPPPPPPPKPIDPNLPVEPWDSRRIDIAQYIWGEGYCGPGGPEYVVTLSKLLALSPEMSALVIGAGLGGPCRVLAQEFGVWITGVEESKQLAEAGMELSVMAGLAKKAIIKHYDPKHPDAFERNFDRAFSKEGLHTVEDKLALVRQVQKKLKNDGLFLITDYFLGRDSAVNSDAYKEWKDKEPARPYLVTAEEMVDIFGNSGFTVRVNEDISEHYQTMIAHAWSEADQVVAKLLSQGEEGRQLVEVLMREAELWSRRSKMLAEGLLQMRRFLAVRKATKTMSDW